MTSKEEISAVLSVIGPTYHVTQYGSDSQSIEPNEKGL